MLHRRGTVFPLRGRYFKKGNNPLLYRACFAKGEVRKAFLRGSFVTKKHRNASNIMHQTYRNQPSYFNYKDASLQLLIGPRKTSLQSYSSYSNSNSSFFPPRCSGLISCSIMSILFSLVAHPIRKIQKDSSFICPRSLSRFVSIFLKKNYINVHE